MLSAQDPPTPPAPPALQGSRPSGNDIGRAVENAVLGPIRSMVQQQLNEAIAKRDGVQQAYDRAGSNATRAQLRTELNTATREVEKLRSGLDELDARVAGRAPRADQTGQTSVPPDLPFNPRDVVPIVATSMGILFIGFPIAIAMARLMWKRATHIGAPAAAMPADTTRRFDQLEQAVDSIAIEVERISENQRYLTKLLSEPRQNVSVGAGDSGKIQ